MKFIKLYDVTAAKTAELRGLLSTMGVQGARVRIVHYGKSAVGRVNIKSVEDRATVRDCLVLIDACTTYGVSFAKREMKDAGWNGATEIFFRLLTP